MSNYYMRSKKILLVSIIVSLFLGSVPAQAEIGNSTLENINSSIDEQLHYYKFNSDLISVFYVEDDELSKNTANAIMDSLLLMTPDVEAHAISTMNQLDILLENNDFQIAVYVFPTNLDGILLATNNLVQWDRFGILLESHEDVMQIFASGNSLQLQNLFGDRSYLYTSGDEQVDSQHVFVYTLWTIADILENRFDGKHNKLGNDIRMATLQYFGSNFNELVSTSLTPTSPMGAVDFDKLKIKQEEYIRDHQGEVTRIVPEGYRFDEDIDRIVDIETNQVKDDYVMDLISPNAIFPNEHPVSIMPDTSGLRGPIGGIIDTLLPVLLSGVGSTVGLSGATVDSIIQTVQTIPETIGLLADPSSSSIMDFIESIKPMLPIPENQMKYVDMVIGSIFSLRGGVDDINSFILDTIPLLLPEDLLMINGMPLEIILEDFLSIGNEVVDEYTNGNGITDYLIQTFNQKMLLNLTKKVLNDTSLLLDENEITMTVGLIGGIIAIITSLTTTGNIDGLINQYGPQIPQLLTPMISNLDITESEMGIIMGGIGMLLVATGVIEGPPIEDLLMDILVGITGLPLEQILEDGKSLMDAITDAFASDVTSVADFQNNYLKPALDIMVNQGVISQLMANAILELLTLVLAITKENFSLGGLTNVSDMVLSFLEAFGITDPNTRDAVEQIITLITVGVDFIYHPPNFGKILNDLYTDIKDMFYDLIGFAINLASPGTIELSTLSMEKSPIDIGISLNSIGGGALELNALDVNILTLAESISLIIKLMKTSAGNSVENLLLTLMQSAMFLISLFLDFDLQPYVDMTEALYGEILGLSDNPPSLQEVLDLVLNQFSPTDRTTVEAILGVVYVIYEIFTGGYKTILSKLTEWVVGQGTKIIEDLSSDLDSILNTEEWPLAEFPIPIAFGGFSAFTIEISIGLKPQFEFNAEEFSEMLVDLLFRSTSIFGDQVDNQDIMDRVIQFVDIHPILTASFELTDFGSSDPSFFDYMMDTFGLDLIISGAGSFELSILSFRNGVFNDDSFFEIIAWSFKFEISIQKTLTLLDILTGGAGSRLSKIGKYLGLDSIKIDIWFTLAIEIVKRAASAIGPETSTLSLVISFGFALTVDIDIYIAILEFIGSLEIKFTMIQDLISPVPMQVFTSILLTVDVFIAFLWWDWDFHYTWSPEGYSPNDTNVVTSNTPEAALNMGAIGGDSDNDGLSDDYEKSIPGLNPNNEDSDNDGLVDKLEIQILGTDPTRPDTDNDGLNDNIEFETKTDPFYHDSDYDLISDYDEIAIYHTNPLSFDTDEDGLNDYYEINHAYDMSDITPTVDFVMIGGVKYTDHTDPLVKDTDADGLFDGQEDIQGIYYSPNLFDFSQNDIDPNAEPNNAIGSAILRNGGYTHPLDSDTDDDSYLLDVNGNVISPRKFLFDMSDYNEIHGISVVFKIDGIPQAPQIIRTNPICPDSDLDLLSDGYELANGPTDPLSGDTDNDGLMDGLEGMLLQNSSHTDPNRADTDGDGFGDLQELQMGSDPRSADTDRDGLSDYEEFFIFGTNLFLADTDSDNIVDGDEIWFYHTNPFLADTDADGISDYIEIFLDTSNPIDEDSDNDFLSDFDEIYIHFTDPWDDDSDNDGLVDGDEVLGLNYTKNSIVYVIYTDPLNPDTDGDSMTALDENGEMSLSLTDYEEYILGLDPTSSDSDLDGITDAWELWLAKGQIPNFDPILLDPLSNDTDNDGLFDGSEMIIANYSTLLNPYVGHYIIFPFDSRPDIADTDGDLLIDSEEIRLGLSPSNSDTDSDTINDYIELNIYFTNPAKDDTDGDGLTDYMEINGFDPLNVSIGLPFNIGRVIFTNATQSDTDGDMLPDGAEVYFYNKDPLTSDQNGNSVIDGLDIDSDFDGLYDGEEFYIYNTVGSAEGGGILQPDSDRDGLFDGQEVHKIDTLPDNWDTDGDTYSDGLELACGSDPKDNTTTLYDLELCFNPEPEINTESEIIIVSPLSYLNYSANQIPVIIYDIDDELSSIAFHFKLQSSDTWSDWVNMQNNIKHNDGYWVSVDGFTFDELTGLIEIEFEGIRKDFTVLRSSTNFTINEKDEDELDYFFISSPLMDNEFIFLSNNTINIPVMIMAGMSYSNVWFDILDGSETLHNNVNINYDNSFHAFYYPEYSIEQGKGSNLFTLKAYGNTTSGLQAEDEIQFTITVIPIEDIIDILENPDSFNYAALLISSGTLGLGIILGTVGRGRLSKLIGRNN